MNFTQLITTVFCIMSLAGPANAGVTISIGRHQSEPSAYSRFIAYFRQPDAQLGTLKLAVGFIGAMTSFYVSTVKHPATHTSLANQPNARYFWAGFAGMCASAILAGSSLLDFYYAQQLKIKQCAEKTSVSSGEKNDSSTATSPSSEAEQQPPSEEPQLSRSDSASSTSSAAPALEPSAATSVANSSSPQSNSGAPSNRNSSMYSPHFDIDVQTKMIAGHCTNCRQQLVPPFEAEGYYSKKTAIQTHKKYIPTTLMITASNSASVQISTDFMCHICKISPIISEGYWDDKGRYRITCEWYMDQRNQAQAVIYNYGETAEHQIVMQEDPAGPTYKKRKTTQVNPITKEQFYNATH